MGQIQSNQTSVVALPFFWAARNGNVGVVQLLLDCGASPTTLNKRGDCPLGAMVNAPGGLTAERVAVLQIMAERLDPVQRVGRAAVRSLLAACEAGSTQYVGVFIAHKIRLPPPDGMQPTTNAQAVVASVTTARSVITNPNDIHLPGLNGIGAIGTAAPLTQRPVQRPRTARTRASGGGIDGLNLVSVGIGEGSSNSAPTNDGNGHVMTPLLAAAGKSSQEVVSLLLKQDEYSRSYINATLVSGKSALYLAAERGEAQICNELLCASASLDVTTCSGRSALYVAVEHEHAETVRTICHYAEVRHLLHQTPTGMSAIVLAERRGNPSLITPMLQCYHHNMRRRHQVWEHSETFSDPTDRYIAMLCQRFKDHLLHDRGVSVGERHSKDAARVQSVTQNTGHKGIMEHAQPGADGVNEIRRTIQSRTGFSPHGEQQPRHASVSHLAPGIACHRKLPARGPQPKRPAWGVSVLHPRRPASAPVLPRRKNSRNLVARGTSGELWNAALDKPALSGTPEHGGHGGLGKAVCGRVAKSGCHANADAQHPSELFNCQESSIQAVDSMEVTLTWCVSPEERDDTLVPLLRMGNAWCASPKEEGDGTLVPALCTATAWYTSPVKKGDDMHTENAVWLPHGAGMYSDDSDDNDIVS